MPRIIMKCPYLKGGTAKSAAHIANLVEYIATRDGVEFVSDANRTLPATKNPRDLIAKILCDTPDAKNLFEHEDYLRQPTIENASEFITQALDHALHESGNRDYYIKYIAERPHVEKIGTHGLFSEAGKHVVLSQVCDEVASHGGNIWTPIISLRREDAVRLSYDSARQWQALLRSHANDIAQSMKIHPDNFRWYASFHKETHHPHVHMVCYSTNPREGYLTKDGIREIKSVLARQIFRQDLTHIYEQQTDRRTQLNAQSLDVMREMCEKISTGTCDNSELERLLLQLSDNLSNANGKKVFAFLSPEQKNIVNQIVDELAKDERVAACYNAWCEMREEVLRTYSDTMPPRLPLSEQKEFKPIKNMIIAEAVKLGSYQLFTLDDCAMLDDFLIEETEPEIVPISKKNNFKVDWSERYQEARAFLFGNVYTEPDLETARELLLIESENGNALAKHDLGKMFADGLGCEVDTEESRAWYVKALDTFLAVESKRTNPYTQYRIGKMYAAGLGTEQDYMQAAEWFEKAVTKKHKYAQYSLGQLFCNGLGVPKDFEKAFDLYKKSAKQHNQFAQYALGKIYLSGEDLPKDIPLAIEWLEKSAGQYNQFAQYQLGKLYLMGKEVPRDREQSHYWLELSAEQGNEYAQFFLDNFDNFRDPSITMMATRLLQQLGKIFEEQHHQIDNKVMQIDRKRQKQLREKKLAQGHARGDHEQTQS